MNTKLIALAAAAVVSFAMPTVITTSEAEARYKGGSHRGFSVVPGSGYNGGVRWYYNTDGGRGGMAATAKEARKAGRILARGERKANRGGFKAERGGPCGGYTMC